MRELLPIGEVAKLIGVSPKTIRYYHEIGLLPEPTAVTRSIEPSNRESCKKGRFRSADQDYGRFNLSEHRCKRTDGGYRLYTAQDLLRLQRIRRLRSLGLHLDHIKEILGETDIEQEILIILPKPLVVKAVA